ncbi:C-type lectin domain family 17, member A-like [Rana temporaria]|uniref:C-type lectin domain family 17, member A-like n=1 Tax=Rana temporaria TaxID=8407 RepID=UPI001AACBE5F|nr:C-type lectin domain family 17, member A-like [Rana temporaria]
MQNVYSIRQQKKACGIVDDDEDDYENVSDITRPVPVPKREKKIGNTCMMEDLQLKSCSIVDDDDDDYENASDLSRTPAVPAREKKIDTTGKMEDLHLKSLPKPVNFSCNQDHLNVASGTSAGLSFQPPFQPPRIGLDFSSSAVNSAFKDLPDVPISKRNQGPGWMKLVLVMCLILIFLMVILITSIMLIYYPSISNQLSDIKQNVSEIEVTARIEMDIGAENLRRVNETFGNKINSLEKEILSIKRFVGLCTSCPPDWNILGSTCYYFSKSHKKWEESRKDCIKRGSTLLILKSKKELDVLLPATGNKRFWIGLRKVSGAWKWVDETVPTFTNWNPGEPNNYESREHYTEMIAGKWNDLDSQNTIDYICERLADC